MGSIICPTQRVDDSSKTNLPFPNREAIAFWRRVWESSPFALNVSSVIGGSDRCSVRTLQIDHLEFQ